jgi:hypothetical protein
MGYKKVSFTTTGLADFFQQGCQIFLGPKYQNGEKYTRLPQNTYTKWPWNISNARKTDQMVIKYTKIFHSKTLQNILKLGFLV